MSRPPLAMPLRHWWCRLAILIGAVVIPLGSCEGSREDPAAELKARLDASAGQRFGFLYEAGGTAVLDCMLPNRQFHVTVDPTSGVVEVRREGPSGSPLAVSRPNGVLIHRSAFAGTSVPTEWISVPGAPGDPAPEVVSAALGVDAASYVLSPGVPDDGAGMVAALLDSATEVTALDVELEDIPSVDGYRLQLPADAKTSPAGSRDVVVDVWVDQDQAVRRVIVFEPGSDTSGWTLNFTDPAQALDVSPAAVTDLSDALPLRQAAVPECRLG